MHQTTIRFPSDTWSLIEREARLSGVSAAQYVREAAVTRLSLAPHGLWPTPAVGESGESGARAARAEASSVREGSEAVWAQAQLARKRAREMREAARAIQAHAWGRA